MAFSLVQYFVDFEFFAFAFVELGSTDAVHFAFQLVVDVEIGPDGTFEVLLLHTGIRAFDDLYHFGTVGVEFIVPLRWF